MKKFLMVLALSCLCSGCTRVNEAPPDETTNWQPEGTADAQTQVDVTKSSATDISGSAESETPDTDIDIDSLIGTELPLSHYRYSISDGMLDENITEDVVEDREQFTLWSKEELHFADVLQQEAEDAGIGVIPVELGTERIKYKAIKVDNGVYIIDTYGGFEIRRGKEAVHLTAETTLRLCGRKTELGFVDVLGSGTPQIRIAGYDSGTGYIRQGVFIFNMETMRFVEFENSDEYLMGAYQECVETYLSVHGDPEKEDFKFYLSDREQNVFNGARPWVEGEDEFLYHRVNVVYSASIPQGAPDETRIAQLKAVYEYSPEQNMFLVTGVQIVYDDEVFE